MTSSPVLYSQPFGPFNPLEPETIPGLFASNIVAEPVEIDAPLELVWEIMTGFEHYPEWNPMNRFFKLDNEAKPGDRVTFGPSWGPYEEPLPEADFVQRETLTVWEENACLSYADFTRFFSAERSQYICALENGKTRYQTYERISGPGGFIMKWIFGKKILRGFTANGLALKKRAEALARAKPEHTDSL